MSLKKICPENVVISEIQGKNDTGIVGLLSSSTQNSYGFRSVRDDGFECETLRVVLSLVYQKSTAA